jgi:nucleoid-associated protein YgaU
MIGELGTLIERRASLEEGDAIRAFLMSAAQELAAAVREELRPGSTSVSAEEKQILARIAVQLRATEADNLRRRRAAAVAPKPQQAAAEAARAIAQRQAAAEAQKQAAAAEAQKQAAAEAQRQAAAAEAQKQVAAAEAQRQAAAAEAQKQAAAAAAPGPVRIYVVKPGDTLSGIAKQMYGKAARWPEIYEANKDRIKDPNLIRPGWQLRIP